MGFHEDDRIRNKNLPSNEAFRLFEAFKTRYWSDNDIISYATVELVKNPTNRVMYALIKICEVNLSTDTKASHNID